MRYLSKVAVGLTLALGLCSPAISRDEIKISAVGDVMLDRGVERQIKSRGVSYVFGEVKDEISKADIAFANLESQFSYRDRGNTKMQFRADPKYLQSLADAGFDVLSTANNHAGDYSIPVTESDAILREKGIGQCGSGYDITGSNTPFIINANGVPVAFLAYTDISNYPRSRVEANHVRSGLTWATKDNIRAGIKKAKKEAELILVSFHWGNEYQHYPTKRQRELAHFAVDCGADAVIGHHPHVLQGIERYKNAIIAYSLGNFIFDQPWQDTRDSMILELYCDRNRVLDYRAIPIIIDRSRPTVAGGKQKESIARKINNYSRRLGQ